MERFYRAALQFKDDYYFRATGDNPIVDYENPRRSLEHLVNNKYEYTAERYMPLGSVVEAFTFEALERCFSEAETAADKEHVTLFIKKSKRFNVGYIKAPPAYHYPELRLTVDYPDDFKRAERIIENLYRKNNIDGVYIPHFKEIIDYCNKQGWLKNKHL
ncbi:MAG: hypothetical protein GY757_51885 [bacterium]|nr:hypothetical protein [bacterium]